MRKYLRKQLGLIVWTFLSDKASARRWAALLYFNVFKLVEACYHLMILIVAGSFISDALCFSQMDVIILS